MGKHENKSTVDWQGKFDLTNTKDVHDAGGGQHSTEDIGDPKDHEGEDEK